MMKRIILCEGRTDAILISYFLKVNYGWGHLKRSVVGLPADRENETLNWYEKSQDTGRELAVWGVGGIDQLGAKLSQIIDRNKSETNPINRFERIIMYFDRDTRDDEECLELARSWAESSGIAITEDYCIGDWMKGLVNLRSNPIEEYPLMLLNVVLPPNSPGALESYLVDCIRRNAEHDDHLTNAAREFIASLPDEPYLARARFRPKACLGAILSVMSPDWVFSTLDERLVRVRWEQLIEEENVYAKLADL